jgi:uncharacterized protein
LALVLDTGVLYAALDDTDPRNPICAELLEATREQLVIPAPVLVELDYWVGKFASAEVWSAFCEQVEAGVYAIYPIDSALLMVAAQLEVRYADLPLGLVDASVVATCETLGEPKVATLDRRHFGVVRTSEGKSLQILPET